MILTPRDYQDFALNWITKRTIVEGHKGAGLLLDPGLGKTAISLAWIRLIKQLDPSAKFLVIAPLSVIPTTWPEEIQEWTQFNGLRAVIVHGKGKEDALRADADIYLINPEGLPWLESEGPHDFHLIVDESTKFKNWGGVRMKVLRRMIKRGEFRKRLILTGTPTPNSLQDLFSQVFLLDEGEALGKNITAFRKRYCVRGGFKGYQWELRPGAEEEIWERIAPLCLRMSIHDHLDLPEMLIHEVYVNLPPKAKGIYKQLEKELFAELDRGQLLPMNEGAKYLKCKQVSNGSVYNTDKEVEFVHKAKIDAVVNIIDELQGKPVMVAYQFKHDLASIKKQFGEVPHISGETSSKETQKYVTDWNAGKIPILAVQPQSLSHGVNMQKGPGRDIIWMGLPDQPELYHQLNARIYRQGVSSEVRIHQILSKGTVDLAIRNRLQDKDAKQQSLFEYLKEYQKRVR
jgi:SNF2 family DNA or RNA helicase